MRILLIVVAVVLAVLPVEGQQARQQAPPASAYLENPTFVSRAGEWQGEPVRMGSFPGWYVVAFRAFSSQGHAVVKHGAREIRFPRPGLPPGFAHWDVIGPVIDPPEDFPTVEVNWGEVAVYRIRVRVDW